MLLVTFLFYKTMKIYELSKDSRALRLLTKSRVSNLVRMKDTNNGKVAVYANVRNFMIISNEVFPSLFMRRVKPYGRNKCVRIANSLIKNKKLCK